jgi:tRNA pseudouridine38-40 synthase
LHQRYIPLIFIYLCQKKTIKLHRYFIQLSYKGTLFHGWQRQNNAPTVQEEVEKTLSTLLKAPTQVMGAGRTDTGVHAQYYIAHFDALQDGLHHDQNLVYKINQLVHPDVAVQKIIKVANGAHARFDALSREYTYCISLEKDPFNREFCYVYQGRLDIEAMKKSAGVLFGFEDFKSFCKLHSDVKTTKCKILVSEWEYKGSQMVYKIKADRFLRDMVRAIVGTMFEIGRGRLGIQGMKAIIEGRNRQLAGPSAPACGLALTNIEYKPQVFHFE